MENEIVLLTNLKGGVGKTTLCYMLATFCAELELPTIVYDADTQLSLARLRKDDMARSPGVEPYWKVVGINLRKNVRAAVSELRRIPGIVLVDCPGSIDTDELRYLFEAATVAVVPFNYDRLNIMATRTFSEIFRRINAKARMVFVPNMIKDSEERRESLKAQRGEAYDALHGFGYLTPKIKAGVALHDSNTLRLTPQQRYAVKYAFEQIVKTITKY